MLRSCHGLRTTFILPSIESAKLFKFGDNVKKRYAAIQHSPDKTSLPPDNALKMICFGLMSGGSVSMSGGMTFMSGDKGFKMPGIVPMSADNALMPADKEVITICFGSTSGGNAFMSPGKAAIQC